MANVNQRISNEIMQADMLDALQRARRQLGSDIAAQDPAYFGVNIAQPTSYPMEQHAARTYQGADLVAQDNYLRSRAARTLNDMGIPLAAIPDFMSAIESTPYGLGAYAIDKYLASGIPDILNMQNSGPQPYAIDSSPRPTSRPAGLLSALGK